jgi:hypothetical protein
MQANRFVATAPQWLSATAYGAVWVAPQALPSGVARILALGMVVEFLLIHSFPFLFVLGAGDETGRNRWRRSLGLLAMGSIYLVFAGALAAIFHSPAPLWTFGWLIASRVAAIWFGSEPKVREIASQTGGWGRSAALYIGGAIATAILPVPRLGLTAEAAAAIALPGSGDWVDSPQKLFAFGFFYFAANAWFASRAPRE